MTQSTKNWHEWNCGDKTDTSHVLKPDLLQENWALDPIGEAIHPAHSLNRSASEYCLSISVLDFLVVADVLLFRVFSSRSSGILQTCPNHGCGVLIFLWNSNSEVRKFRTLTLTSGPISDSGSNSMTCCHADCVLAISLHSETCNGMTSWQDTLEVAWPARTEHRPKPP